MIEFNDLTSLLTNYGLTREMIILLLYVPILATLVNFSRYIVGMKTLGIYAPMTLSFAYIFTGIRFGLLVTAAVIAATIVTYSMLKKVRMHYLSRITTNYILITFFVILVIALNEALPISFTTDRHDAETIPPLGIILIATLSDFFIKQYVKKSFINSFRSLIETVLVGVAGWALLRSESLQSFVLNEWWLMPALFFLNLTLGKYTGVRIKDLFRFKSIIKKD